MAVSPAKPQRDSRLGRRIKLAVVIVLAALGVLLIGGFVWLVTALDGGFSGWWLDAQSSPDFTAGQIAGLRNTVKRQIDNDFATGVPADLQQFATGSSDECYKGQHNFEVNDSFAYACSYRQTNYYGFNGDFGQTITALEAALTHDGWKTDFGVGRVLSDYYKPYYKGPGSNYTVGTLPGTDYYGKNDMFVHVQWIERGDTDTGLFANDLHPGADNVWTEEHDVDAQAVAANVFQANRYAVSIAIHDASYYQK